MCIRDRELESRYLDLQFRVALDLYNKTGAEGQIGHTENSISRTWESSWISEQGFHFLFGSLEDYDRTATTADTACQIDEDSVLWVDGSDTDGPYNYIVKRKAPWKNSVQYAIKRVKVSEYEAEQKLFARKAEIEAAMLSAQNQTETEHGLDQPSIEGSQDVPKEG